MSWWSAIGGAVSSVVGWLGAEDEKDAAEDAADRREDELRRVAQDNKELSLYDADVARKIGINRRFEYEAKAGLMYNKMQTLLSQQRTRYAKSGVALKSGSPVDVLEKTTKDAAKDIMNVKYAGRSAKAAADSLASRYELLAEKGLRDAAAQASLIQEAAADKVDAIQWGQIGTAVSNIYEWTK